LPGAIPDRNGEAHKNPSLARAAFEETIRFESPAQTFSRTTTRPAEIGGVQLDAGEKSPDVIGRAIAIRANGTGQILRHRASDGGPCRVSAWHSCVRRPIAGAG